MFNRRSAPYVLRDSMNRTTFNPGASAYGVNGHFRISTPGCDKSALTESGDYRSHLTLRPWPFGDTSAIQESRLRTADLSIRTVIRQVKTLSNRCR